MAGEAGEAQSRVSTSLKQMERDLAEDGEDGAAGWSGDHHRT